MPEGFSVWQREYDKYNHVILEQYLDEFERIASLTDRQTAFRIVYDARGNRTRIEYLSAALQPVETAMGYYRLYGHGRKSDPGDSGLCVCDSCV